MPPVPDGAAGFSNGSRTCSTRSGGTRKKVDADVVRPAGHRHAHGRLLASASGPALTWHAVDGDLELVPIAGAAAPPPRSTLISYSASTGKT